MTRFLTTLLFIFMINFSISASGSGEQNGELEIEDTFGNIIKLEKIPERITFVGKASNMIADVLYMFPEASERVVGVGNTNQRNGDFVRVLDPDYNSKVYLEHTVGPEQVAVTNPDLVLMKSFMKEKLGNALEQLGIAVLYLDLESPEGYEKDFKMLGEIFGNSERADELINYYRNEKNFIENITKTAENKPDVLFLYHSTRDGISAFNIPPESWIQTKMVEMAGGNPLWTGIHPGGGWSKINLEQIAVMDPDQIYIAAYKEDINEVLNSMNDSPQWQEFSAVKNGKLKAFPVDFYSWDQPNSRWLIGLKWLAKQIHPEMFTQLDINEMTRKFYKDLYFLSENQIENEIISRLGW